MTGRHGGRRWQMAAAAGVAGLALVLAGVVWPRESAVSALTNCDTPGGYSLDSVEWEVLALVNEHRAANGREPLSPSATLSHAAQWMANDMAAHNNQSHTDTLGRNFMARFAQCGHSGSSWVGENIAWGYSSAASVFNAWKNSAGHNANMLDPRFRTAGVGRAFGSYWNWTLDLGTADGGWDGNSDSGPPPTKTAGPTKTPVPTDTPRPTATPTTVWYQSYAAGSARE